MKTKAVGQRHDKCLQLQCGISVAPEQAANALLHPPPALLPHHSNILPPSLSSPSLHTQPLLLALPHHARVDLYKGWRRGLPHQARPKSHGRGAWGPCSRHGHGHTTHSWHAPLPSLLHGTPHPHGRPSWHSWDAIASPWSGHHAHARHGREHHASTCTSSCACCSSRQHGHWASRAPIASCAWHHHEGWLLGVAHLRREEAPLRHAYHARPSAWGKCHDCQQGKKAESVTGEWP